MDGKVFNLRQFAPVRKERAPQCKKKRKARPLTAAELACWNDWLSGGPAAIVLTTERK